MSMKILNNKDNWHIMLVAFAIELVLCILLYGILGEVALVCLAIVLAPTPLVIEKKQRCSAFFSISTLTTWLFLMNILNLISFVIYYVYRYSMSTIHLIRWDNVVLYAIGCSLMSLASFIMIQEIIKKRKYVISSYIIESIVLSCALFLLYELSSRHSMPAWLVLGVGIVMLMITFMVIYVRRKKQDSY